MRWHQRLGLAVLRPIWRMTRGTTLGVRAILLDDNGQVVLVRHGYMDGWHLPGGGVEPVGAPELFGLYTNFQVFAGDHVAVFVVRGFTGAVGGPSGLEIRERGVFPLDALPADTAAPTRRRLVEFMTGAPRAATW